MAMVYFYTVKRGDSVRYEGGSYVNAMAKFEEIAGWIKRNGKTEQVSFEMKPFEERVLGGSPQHG